VVSGSVVQALAITVPIGVPLFALLVLASGSWGALWSFSENQLWILAAAGVVHFVWGRYCFYRATKALGSILVAPLQQLSMLVALVLAVVLLGEKLTPLRIIGLVLVIWGPILAVQDAGKGSPKPEGGWQPNYVEGYFWGLLSVLGTGLSPILVRAAVEGMGAGAALAGGLISYIAGTIVFVAAVVATGQVAHAVSMDRQNALWFANAGFFVFLSHVFRYLAYVYAPVTVVAPIERTTVLFRLAFSYFLNREHEVFHGRVILATIMSLVGAVLLTLSTDAVANLGFLPDWLREASRWQWP
jgi:uncharacterized membrane protein